MHLAADVSRTRVTTHRWLATTSPPSRGDVSAMPSSTDGRGRLVRLALTFVDIDTFSPPSKPATTK